MKHVRVLTKDGVKKRLSKINPWDEVLGIILRSGRIVSLNIYNPSPSDKLFWYNFSKINSNKILDQEKAEKDMGGEENTKALLPHLTIKIKDIEYIPALGELKEAIRRLREINYVRKILGLVPISSTPIQWFLSSTIKNDDLLWFMFSDGLVSLNFWNGYYGNYGIILTFLKND